MVWYLVVFFFLLSCVVLSWLGAKLINSLVRIGRYLQWKEFVLTFFVVAFAASLPNFFVDFNAVLRGAPEVALGDVLGGDLADLTIVLAIAVLFTKNGISSNSQMVQRSAIFTSLVAVLPVLLLIDQELSRLDGVLLLLAFALYVAWLFGEKSRFSKVYNGPPPKVTYNFRKFIGDLIKMAVFVALLLVCSFFVVDSAKFFAASMGVPLALVGILIVSLGNCFPETYFAIISARQKENWMVLGDLMGSVVICSTFELGLIALLFPFSIKEVSIFVTARMFLIAAAIFSLIFIVTGRRITKKEGFYLLLIYVAFLLTEIFVAH